MDAGKGRGAGSVFALTTLLGAFLLFQVQPILAKRILPWFGGGPAVWTTCMVFFQSVLVLGYAYAHVSERRLPGRARLVVHLLLLLAAPAFLPPAPDERWKPGGLGEPAWEILQLLAVQVGVPYFLLASTGPLVQAWFARACPGRSPYRLYALSNAGSLAALLTYPVAVEPFLGLRAQSMLWSALYLAFAALSAAGAVLAGRPRPVPDEPPGDPPSAVRRALWVLLPAFASWLLLAVTHRLGQDVAVVPFLWVLPLAAYLLSFILAFDHPRWYRPGVFLPATAALVLVAAGASGLPMDWAWRFWLVLGGSLGALFGACVVCHGELARLRPEPARLTGYYLAIAAGGALGGLFVSLAAPRIFSTLVEWKLGLGIAYLGACGFLLWGLRGWCRAHPVPGVILMALCAVGASLLGTFLRDPGRRVESARSFHGVLEVKDVPWRSLEEGDSRELVNGRILHGRQYRYPDHRRLPTTYYVQASGVGRALGLHRWREDLRVGCVGLGVGTLAAYLDRPTQSIRFYEISPDVVRLAGKHFTFLSDCPGRVEVATGDARLSLERETPQGFHVLVLDAFTGDLIPTHLLTLEAMDLYARHLAPEGTIAVHVSNRTLDLAPVVRGAARRLGLRALLFEHAVREDQPGESSTWMLLTRDEGAYRSLAPFAEAPDGRERVWTDEHGDLFSSLKLR
jgi:hypothetical protein